MDRKIDKLMIDGETLDGCDSNYQHFIESLPIEWKSEGMSSGAGDKFVALSHPLLALHPSRLLSASLLSHLLSASHLKSLAPKPFNE